MPRPPLDAPEVLTSVYSEPSFSEAEAPAASGFQIAKSPGWQSSEIKIPGLPISEHPSHHPAAVTAEGRGEIRLTSTAKRIITTGRIHFSASQPLENPFFVDVPRGRLSVECFFPVNRLCFFKKH